MTRMVDTYVPLMMEWDHAARAVGWEVTSVSVFHDVIILSAVREGDIVVPGRVWSGAIARTDSADVMLDALKTMLRLEGA